MANRRGEGGREGEEEEEGEGAREGREGVGFEGCVEGLAVWEGGGMEWRVWASQSLPAVRSRGGGGRRRRREGGEDEEEKEERVLSEEEDGEEEEMVLLDKYNVTGRLLVLGQGEEEEEEEEVDLARSLLRNEEEEEGEKEEGLIFLAAEGEESLFDKIRKLKPVGLLLIQSEDARQRRRRAAPAAAKSTHKKRKQEEEEEEGEEEGDLFLSSLPCDLPVRFVSEDVARDLRLTLRQHREEDGDRLRVWLACGFGEIDRNKINGEEEDKEEEDEEDEEKERKGYRSVTYEGVVYRTLDRAVIDVTKTGCQSKPLPLPEGYEIAPAYDKIIEEVVKHHTWGTSFILLRATGGGGGREGGGGDILQVPPVFAAYTTAIHEGRAGQLLESGNDLVEESSEREEQEEGREGGLKVRSRYRPTQCDSRILIRGIVPTISYGGFVYRTLEPHIAVDEMEVPFPKREAFGGVDKLDLPEGWELAPVNRGIAQQVVAGHSWGTDALILADGKGYPTLLFFHRRALRQKQKQKQQQQQQQQQQAFAPHYRILIRRPVEEGEDGREGGSKQDDEGRREGGREEGVEYRMGDMYRADASAVVELRRLAEEDVGYLIEVELTETIMIHGGIDLTGVKKTLRRKRGEGREEGEEEEGGLLKAWEREVGRGEGREVLWEEGVEGGVRQYRVFKM